MNDILRRKVARAALASPEGGPGADYAWRLAFARAARNRSGLLIEVTELTVHRRSLAELLELPPERAMLALLDGPQGGLGLMAMSSEVMAALIEMQTTARVSTATPIARKPTRTDAAMVAGVIDLALEELEQILIQEADLVWAGGFRYASFLEDPRPLGLLLEDQPFRVLTAQLSLADGVRSGSIILALPAEGRGQRPAQKTGRREETADPGPSFTEAIGTVVMGADCVLQAVLGRLTMPLLQVMDLKVDQVLALPDAALDKIELEGIDGRKAAMGRLGQQRGLRALRLSQGAVASPAPSPAPRPKTEAAAPPGPMPQIAGMEDGSGDQMMMGAGLMGTGLMATG